MYNSYLGTQQPPVQQGYQQQPSYQVPQATGYAQPPQQQQQPQPQFLQTQATGYPYAPPQQTNQYGIPPLPPIPTQYTAQTGAIGVQPTGYVPQQPFQPGPPQSLPVQQPPPPATSAPTGHQRQTSTSLGTSARIPNVRLSFLTTPDQIKFEQLFRSAVGNEQALEGEKARDILLRSKLNPDILSQIWQLSDTTKSGRLMFPEFALAMYLCNLQLTGKSLPDKVPERIMNEVSSMVDIISFGVPDSQPTRETPRSNVPNFEVTPSQTGSQPAPAPGPRPSESNIQTLATLSAQPTGYMPPSGFGSISAQGSLSAPGSFAAQGTGYGPPQRMSPQPTLQPTRTGFQPTPSNLGIGAQFTGVQTPPRGNSLIPPNALQSQPTGRPGQWGFVSAPAGSLAGIQALQAQLMPQPGREGAFSSAGLQGTANVPWAITKDEKTIYDGVFQAWDGLGRGYIGGDTAIEIFGQSGLPGPDLERIWTLSDPGNKGKLDRDEFAVALHLIYRRLNGYEIPLRLPPELIPPSSRAFASSVGQVKSFLQNDINARQRTGLTMQPTGYGKARSFREDPASQLQKKDASVYRFNDNEVGYISSARRRGAARSDTPSIGTRSPSPPAADPSSKEDEIQRLRKEIREKQILLEAVDIRDEARDEDDVQLERRDRQDADDLYRRVRRLQDEIDSLPNASTRSLDNSAEKRALRRQLQSLSDRLPQLASEVRETEKRIADAKLRLFRMKDAKENPGTAIAGTGPNGEVTESDRRKAKANAMLQARMAALTGKPAPPSNDDFDGAARRLATETEKVRKEREDNERIIQGIEESAEQLKEGLERSLKEDGVGGDQGDHERRRWEEGVGVEDEVRDFIFDLQRQSREAKSRVRSPPRREETPRVASSTSRESAVTPTPAAATAKSTTTSSSSYSNFKTAEERAAWVKQQAQQRMNERLAALGIKPVTKAQSIYPPDPEPLEEEPKPANGFTSRKADEDAVRKQKEEQDRQQAERARQEEQRQQEEKRRQEELQRQEAARVLQQQKEEEARLRAEQERQERQRKEMEERERQEEEELLREKAAQEERIKAMQRDIEAGKARKARESEIARQREEQQRKLAEREERLRAMRAEVEARKEEERRLQMEREALEREIVEPPPAAVPPAPVSSAPPAPNGRAEDSISAPQEEQPISPPEPKVSAAASKTGTNPFLKLDSQATPVTVPSTTPDSTNPFFRMAAQATEKAAAKPAAPAFSTASRDTTDDWDLVASDEENSEDEDESAPAGRRAVDLASMLFGGMSIPPRAMDSPTPSATPTSAKPAEAAAAEIPRPPTPPPPEPLPVPAAVIPQVLPPNEPSPPPPMFSPPAPPPPPPPPPQFSPPAVSSPNYDTEAYFSPTSFAPPPPPANLPPPPPMAPFSAPPPPPPPPPPPAVPPMSSPPPAPFGAPPPPPPFFGAPPPPPPSFGSPPPPPPLASAPAPPSGGPLSGALLSSIQQGKSLRKVQTVDKSGPPSAGRVL